MGAQIWKGNQNYGEIDSFDIANHDVQPQKFRNPSRTLSQSLRTYQFNEKIAISYEMDYFSESVYQKLRALLDNRSSKNDGIFTLPIPYSHNPTSCIIQPEEGTGNQVYFLGYQQGDIPWEQTTIAVGNELDSGQYTDISATNDSFYHEQLADEFYAGLILKFDLSSFISNYSKYDIRRLTFVSLGMESSPINFYIFSHSAQAWYLITEKHYYQTSDFPLLYQQQVAQFGLPMNFESIWSDFLDNGNHAWIMMVNNEPGKNFLLKHARLIVNGYWVCPDGVENIENFSTYFTGAGRTGQLKFLEI